MFRWTVLNLLYELDAGDFLKIACGTLELSNDIDCTLKAGESINTASTTNKKEIYSDSTHVKAFKIGFRFLADMAQDEYDIGVGECAIHPSELKAVKANLQGKQKTLLINMVDLVDIGLYVADFKYSFVIPSTTAQFIEKIDAILKIFLTMQGDVIRLAIAILAEENKPTSHGNAFNRPSQSHHINPRLGFTRDTYYTPPKGAASRLSHYYGPPPRSILPLLQALSEEDRAPRPIDNDNQVYDVYGYKTLEDGTFYNKFTNKTTATHPMIPSKE